MHQATSSPSLESKPRIEGALSKSDRVALSIIIGLQHLVAFAPFLMIAILFIFSWRVGSIIGHWPIPWQDDPKYSTPGDLLSDLLYYASFLFLMLSFAAYLVLPAAILILWQYTSRASRLWSVLLVVVFIIGFLVMRSDPGDRFRWLMD
jgi:ABC-type Na+ efflux pump permease subunit